MSPGAEGILPRVIQFVSHRVISIHLKVRVIEPKVFLNCFGPLSESVVTTGESP